MLSCFTGGGGEPLQQQEPHRCWCLLQGGPGSPSSTPSTRLTAALERASSQRSPSSSSVARVLLQGGAGGGPPGLPAPPPLPDRAMSIAQRIATYEAGVGSAELESLRSTSIDEGLPEVRALSNS